MDAGGARISLDVLILIKVCFLCFGVFVALYESVNVVLTILDAKIRIYPARIVPTMVLSCLMIFMTTF